MTNNNMYFIANWKMFGKLSSINSINKVIKLSKSNEFSKTKIIYCPPYTLLKDFVQKTKKTKISIGAQDCHYENNYGPFTGSINAKQIKNTGANYTIVGHSEKRSAGDTNIIVNKKVICSLREKLNVILCIGETLKEKQKGMTTKIINKQLEICLKNIKDLKKVIIAYEPVWSIGTGKVLKVEDLNVILKKIKIFLKKKYKIKNPKVLYGGSVNSKNILILNKANEINGFLIGSASQKENIFVDILKKSIN